MTTPTSQGPAHAAFERWLESLRAAGEVIVGELGGKDERERAEGFRHVARVADVAREMIIEKGDRTRPEFTRWMSSHRKVFGDNPHTIYDAALVDPTLTYRLTGTRGTTTYLGVCTYGTNPETGARRIATSLDDTELTLDDRGRFELWIGPADMQAPNGADRLTLDPDVTDLMIRQYRHDLEVEVDGEYTIRAVPDPGPPPPLDEATIAARFDEAGAWVQETVHVEATLSALVTSMTPGVLRAGQEFIDAGGEVTGPVLDLEVVAKVMPSPAIQYSGTWFDDLGDDEAIIVEGVAPTARYWSIQLLTRWMESGDWRHHRVFVTDRDVEVDADGRFTVVVSARDPGDAVWLSTSGLRNANVAMRALACSQPLDVQYKRTSLSPSDRTA